MTLYVSVPSYGGVLTVRTAASLMSAVPRALQEGLISDYEINFHGEALINRCRNVHANLALKGGWDKIITIDSDIEFTYEQFKRIITSPHDFIGGSYPLKCFPIVVNFNPLPGMGTELLKSERGYDLHAFEEFRKKYCDAEGLAEVRDIPTGFLCVTKEALKTLTKYAAVYADFHQETGKTTYSYDFYPTRVIDHELLSEDWGLCYLARNAGIKVMFDTNVITSHYGTHLYRLGQIYGEVPIAPK